MVLPRRLNPSTSPVFPIMASPSLLTTPNCDVISIRDYKLTPTCCWWFKKNSKNLLPPLHDYIYYILFMEIHSSYPVSIFALLVHTCVFLCIKDMLFLYTFSIRVKCCYNYISYNVFNRVYRKFYIKWHTCMFGLHNEISN